MNRHYTEYLSDVLLAHLAARWIDDNFHGRDQGAWRDGWNCYARLCAIEGATALLRRGRTHVRLTASEPLHGAKAVWWPDTGNDTIAAGHPAAGPGLGPIDT